MSFLILINVWVLSHLFLILKCYSKQPDETSVKKISILTIRHYIFLSCYLT